MLTSPPAAGLDPEALFAPVAAEKAVGLAVSGGPDSLALLVLYADWQKAAPGRPPALVYAVDHGLRPEARKEAEGVLDLASARGLRARLLSWEGEKPRAGLQAAARRARYRLIGAAMAEDGAGVLLTGHHRSDQAETVLMRLAHGSGITGLAGMTPFAEVEGVRVFRPFLGVAPEALRGVVGEARLEPIDDPFNVNLLYERNRWRHEASYLAELGLDPVTLTRFSGRMLRAEQALCAAVAFYWRGHVRHDAWGVVSMDLEKLLAEPAEFVIRVLDRAIRLAGSGRGAGLAALEALAGELRPGLSPRTLAGAVVATRGGGLLVYREAGRIAPAPLMIEPGEKALWDNRFLVESRALVRVAPALSASRARLGEWGLSPDLPVAALRAAPLVVDEAGRPLAIGPHLLASGVAVRLADASLTR